MLFLVHRGKTPVKYNHPVVTSDDLSHLQAIHSDEAQMLLANIHGKYWLCCDCNASNSPVLTIRRNHSGMFGLANIHGRGKHIDSCSWSYIANIKNPINRHEEIDPANFELLKSKNDQLPPGVFFSTDSSAIARLLGRIYTQSSLDHLQISRTFKENLEVLKIDGLSGVSLSKKPLEECFFSGLSSFRRAKDFLIDQSSLTDTAQVALLFDVADEISINDKYVSTTKYFGKNRKENFKFFSALTNIQCFTSKLDSCSGPFLIFSVITNLGDDQKPLYAPKQVIIVPVLSKANWLLVSNEEQRLIANKLLKSQAWYLNHRKFDCVIRQPLPADFSELVKANTYFVIQNNSMTNRLIVSTKKEDTLKIPDSSSPKNESYSIRSWEYQNYNKFEESSFTIINKIMKSLSANKD